MSNGIIKIYESHLDENIAKLATEASAFGEQKNNMNSSLFASYPLLKEIKSEFSNIENNISNLKSRLSIFNKNASTIENTGVSSINGIDTFSFNEPYSYFSQSFQVSTLKGFKTLSNSDVSTINTVAEEGFNYYLFQSWYISTYFSGASSDEIQNILNTNGKTIQNLYSSKSGLYTKFQEYYKNNYESNPEYLSTLYQNYRSSSLGTIKNQVGFYSDFFDSETVTKYMLGEITSADLQAISAKNGDNNFYSMVYLLNSEYANDLLNGNMTIRDAYLDVYKTDKDKAIEFGMYTANVDSLIAYSTMNNSNYQNYYQNLLVQAQGYSSIDDLQNRVDTDKQLIEYNEKQKISAYKYQVFSEIANLSDSTNHHTTYSSEQLLNQVVCWSYEDENGVTRYTYEKPKNLELSTYKAITFQELYGEEAVNFVNASISSQGATLNNIKNSSSKYSIETINNNISTLEQQLNDKQTLQKSLNISSKINVAIFNNNNISLDDKISILNNTQTSDSLENNLNNTALKSLLRDKEAIYNGYNSYQDMEKQLTISQYNADVYNNQREQLSEKIDVVSTVLGRLNKKDPYQTVVGYEYVDENGKTHYITWQEYNYSDQNYYDTLTNADGSIRTYKEITLNDKYKGTDIYNSISDILNDTDTTKDKKTGLSQLLAELEEKYNTVDGKYNLNIGKVNTINATTKTINENIIVDINTRNIMNNNDFSKYSSYNSSDSNVVNNLKHKISEGNSTYEQISYYASKEDVCYIISSYINGNDNLTVGKTPLNEYYFSKDGNLIETDTEILNNYAGLISYMSDSEKSVFLYKLNKNGSDDAYSYLESLQKKLSQYQVADITAKNQQWASDHRVAASLLSVVTAPIYGFRSIGNSVNYLATGDESYMLSTNTYSAADVQRSQVATDIATYKGNTASFIYQTGMSMADSLINTALIGATGATGIAATAISATTMGARVYSSSLNDALERGVDPTNAIAFAFGSAAVESLMESYSATHLLNLDTKLGNVSQSIMKKIANSSISNETLKTITTKGAYIFASALSQGLCEGEEELATEIIDGVLDEMISGNLSNYALTVQNYMNQGYSEDDAYMQSIKDFGKQVASAFAGGFVSGITMGLAGGSFSSIKTTIDTNAVSQYYDGDSAQAYADAVIFRADVSDNTSKGITDWSKVDKNNSYFQAYQQYLQVTDINQYNSLQSSILISDVAKYFDGTLEQTYKAAEEYQNQISEAISSDGTIDYSKIDLDNKYYQAYLKYLKNTDINTYNNTINQITNIVESTLKSQENASAQEESVSSSESDILQEIEKGLVFLQYHPDNFYGLPIKSLNDLTLDMVKNIDENLTSFFFVVDGKNYTVAEIKNMLASNTVVGNTTASMLDTFSTIEGTNIIEVKSLEPNSVIDLGSKESYNYNNTYSSYDYVIQTTNLQEVINMLNKNNDGANILIELTDLNQLSEELIDQIPDNVEVRIINYNQSHFTSVTGMDYVALGLTYSKEELLQIEAKVNEIISAIDDSWNDYQKAEYVYNYLKDNIDYNDNPGRFFQRTNNYFGLTALIEGIGTCQSFANVYQNIMTLLGIKCEEVWGQIGTTGSHAYNIVTIGDNIFVVDTVREMLINRDESGFAVDKSDYSAKSHPELLNQVNYVKASDSDINNFTIHEENEVLDTPIENNSKTTNEEDNDTNPNDDLSTYKKFENFKDFYEEYGQLDIITKLVFINSNLTVEEFLNSSNIEQKYKDALSEFIKTPSGKVLTLLSAEQIQAIAEYSGEAYHSINDYLRGVSQDNDYYNNILTQIDSIFDNSEFELAENTLLKRTMNISILSSIIENGNVSSIVGKSFSFKQYLSTFMDMDSETGTSSNCDIYIKAASGTKGINITGINGNMETEFLLPRNTTLSFESVEEFFDEDGNKRYKIIASIVDQNSNVNNVNNIETNNEETIEENTKIYAKNLTAEEKINELLSREEISEYIFVRPDANMAREPISTKSLLEVLFDSEKLTQLLQIEDMNEEFETSTSFYYLKGLSELIIESTFGNYDILGYTLGFETEELNNIFDEVSNKLSKYEDELYELDFSSVTDTVSNEQNLSQESSLKIRQEIFNYISSKVSNLNILNLENIKNDINNLIKSSIEILKSKINTLGTNVEQFSEKIKNIIRDFTSEIKNKIDEIINKMSSSDIENLYTEEELNSYKARYSEILKVMGTEEYKTFEQYIENGWVMELNEQNQYFYSIRKEMAEIKSILEENNINVADLESSSNYNYSSFSEIDEKIFANINPDETIKVAGISYSASYVLEMINKGKELKNKVLLKAEEGKTVEEKIRIAYIELNKLVHYDDNYLEIRKNENNKHAYLDHYTDFTKIAINNNVVCQGWSELYSQLLKEMNLPVKSITMMGEQYSHRWVEIDLGNSEIIIADAADATYNFSNFQSIDLIYSKYNSDTYGFMVLPSIYSGARITLMLSLATDKNSFKEFYNLTENVDEKWEEYKKQWLPILEKGLSRTKDIDISTKYATADGKYYSEVIDFANSNFSGENIDLTDEEIFEDLSKITIPSTMNEEEIINYLRRIMKLYGVSKNNQRITPISISRDGVHYQGYYINLPGGIIFYNNQGTLTFKNISEYQEFLDYDLKHRNINEGISKTEELNRDPLPITEEL